MAHKRKVLQQFSLRAIAPSIVTLMAFCFGITSIRFALAEKWEFAVGAIVLAGLLDGLDGTVARLLKSTSRFGAELDSLADVVSFGVSPAVVIYLWTLQGLDRLGWAAALIYAAAMALRLARFNSRMEDDDEPRKKLGFLTGVPAPMGAGLIALPISLDFIIGGDFIRNYPLIMACYVVLVAFLMVSSIATPSLKGLKIKRDYFVPIMLFIVAFIASLFVYTWIVLATIAVGYLCLLPVCVLRFRKKSKLTDL